jgi:hypothetical protein
MFGFGIALVGGMASRAALQDQTLRRQLQEGAQDLREQRQPGKEMSEQRINEDRQKGVVLAILLALSNVALAAEPTCQSQTIGTHTSKVCISEMPYHHDYYTLWVDGTPILTLPDDYVESITLTHRIPDDAAIEFPLSKQGTPTVTISGGCTPISERQESDGKKVGIEVGRSCSFVWGNATLVKDMQFRF